MVGSSYKLSFFNKMPSAFAHFASAVCSFNNAFARFSFKLISLGFV